MRRTAFATAVLTTVVAFGGAAWAGTQGAPTEAPVVTEHAIIESSPEPTWYPPQALDPSEYESHDIIVDQGNGIAVQMADPDRENAVKPPAPRVPNGYNAPTPPPSTPAAPAGPTNAPADPTAPASEPVCTIEQVVVGQEWIVTQEYVPGQAEVTERQFRTTLNADVEAPASEGWFQAPSNWSGYPYLYIRYVITQPYVPEIPEQGYWQDVYEPQEVCR